MPRQLRVIGSLTFAVFAAPLHAQQTTADTLPFHPGQWGIEAGLTAGSAGVGALRFFSRATALTLDLSASTNRLSTDQAVFTPNNASTSRGSHVDASLGLRHYVPASMPIAGFFGAGLAFGYGSSRNDPGQFSQRQTTYGGYAEAGASYFVLPRLALSGSYGVQAGRVTGHVDQLVFGPTDATVMTSTKVHGWNAATTGVRLTAAIFF
jgi:hypothetical protein